MKITAYHDSHQTACRFPFGAVPGGTAVTLHLVVQGRGTEAVFLRLWEQEREILLPMDCTEKEQEAPERAEARQPGEEPAVRSRRYGITFTVPERGCLVWYYFLIRQGEETCWYGNNEAQQGGMGQLWDREPPSFQITVYDRDSVTPAWLKQAVVYQIFPDRFCRGKVPADRFQGKPGALIHSAWEGNPCYVKDKEGQVAYYDFYGGTLEGILEKLPYLEKLGVNCLYLNPIFQARSNHRYDTGDYKAIDPFLGSEETFRILCREARHHGMRILLDGVFSHTGADSRYFNRAGTYKGLGAWQGSASPYYKWYHFREYPEDYGCWWGDRSLPEVTETEPSYLDFIIRDKDSVLHHWLNAGISGWRLDVAADLGHSPEFNHKFWKEFRRVVKEANPEAIILAEHYGDAMSWLQGDEWDTVMNYDAFMEPVSWFLTGMEKHSDEFNQGLLGNSESFIGAMTYHMPAFYAPSLYTAMNELDNHDHSRFLTRTNHRVGRVANVGPYAAAENTNKAVLREAVVIQMTWPGAPTLYYGDEAGQVGFTDPDNRRTYPWGQEDQELIRFYKEMIAVHRRFPVLAMGSLKFLYHDYNVLSYGRFNQEEQVIVVINNRNERVHVEIPVWLTGINRSSVAKLTQVFATDAVGFSSEEKEIEAPAGILEMDLLPLSGVVLHRCEE